ncbi:MAG: hypothetical protein ACYTDX_04610 [Planctomycetota bacterium]|jgi:hypothetical protein
MNIRPRHVVTLTLAVLVGAAAPVSVPGLSPALALEDQDGEETQPPADRYPKELEKAMAEIADLFADAAKYAMSNKLKRTAAETYELVLEYDTDHSKARRELGFKKVKGEWVEDEKKSKKVRRFRDEKEKKRRDFEKKLARAEADIAKIFGSLAATAKTARDVFDESEDEWHDWNKKAVRHWKQTLEMDDQEEAANKGLGNRRIDGTWISDAALRHKEFMKRYRAALEKARKLNVAVVESDQSTGYAEAVNVNVHVYKTKNFRIESNLDVASIRPRRRSSCATASSTTPSSTPAPPFPTSAARSSRSSAPARWTVALDCSSPTTERSPSARPSTSRRTP